ncbi:hypothetical protein KCU90_g94, partial [Aureobasidium melanogenum]
MLTLTSNNNLHRFSLLRFTRPSHNLCNITSLVFFRHILRLCNVECAHLFFYGGGGFFGYWTVGFGVFGFVVEEPVWQAVYIAWWARVIASAVMMSMFGRPFLSGMASSSLSHCDWVFLTISKPPSSEESVSFLSLCGFGCGLLSLEGWSSSPSMSLNRSWSKKLAARRVRPFAGAAELVAVVLDGRTVIIAFTFKAIAELVVSEFEIELVILLLGDRNDLHLALLQLSSKTGLVDSLELEHGILTIGTSLLHTDFHGFLLSLLCISFIICNSSWSFISSSMLSTSAASSSSAASASFFSASVAFL